jgi:hypothetical protein
VSGFREGRFLFTLSGSGSIKKREESPTLHLSVGGK